MICSDNIIDIPSNGANETAGTQNENLGDVKGIFTKLSSAETVSNLKNTVSAVFDKHGITDFLFTVSDKSNKGCISTFPSEICNALLKHNSNLLFTHSVLSTAPIYQTEILSFIENSPIRNEVLDQFVSLAKKLSKLDIHNFYMITNHHMNSALTLILAKRNVPSGVLSETIIEPNKIYIHVVAEIVSMLCLQRFPEYFSSISFSEGLLTEKKPLRLLNMLAKDNVTLKEAAERLHISVDTANKHISKIKKYFGVNTISSAVYHAQKRGLLDIDSFQPPSQEETKK